MPEHEGLIFDGDIPLCPNCHAHSTKHCQDSQTCTWRDCNDQVNCRTYFDGRRYAQREPRP